jgi:hypothetical protein
VRKGFFWLHDGDPKRPHVLLPNGDHANGCFTPTHTDCLLQNAALSLIEQYEEHGGYIEIVHLVLGLGKDDEVLVQYIADEITKQRGLPCYWAIHDEDSNQPFNIHCPEHKRCYGETVLLCVNTITMNNRIDSTIATIEHSDVIALPFVLTLINQSEGSHTEGDKIIALIDSWQPDRCPLCAQGSEAIDPFRTQENFARLTADHTSFLPTNT